MSHRISLDVDQWGSADFIVGRDGSLADIEKQDIWQRPLKVVFRNPAIVSQWLTMLPEWFDVSDVWMFYWVPKGSTTAQDQCEHPDRETLLAWLRSLEERIELGSL